MEEEINPFDRLPDVYAISIIAGEDEPPFVELGDCPPYTALAILERACDALRECILPPRVSYLGQTLYDPYVSYDEEEED